MKFFIATILLATCLAAQAKNIPNSPAITLLDFYKQKGNSESRIISGQPSTLGQFPYQAAVWMNFPDGEVKFCGGTLISSKWILTAAHCASGVASWDVKLGGIYIDRYEPGQEVQRSYKGIVHPEYNSQHLHNDVALIELPNDVSFTDNIQPLRLPRRAEADDRLENIRVRVSGWGKISDSDPGANIYMSYVDLDTITNSECFKDFWNSVIDSTICCKGHPNHSTCNGDSGGPLVRTADDGQLTHIGVVSFVHEFGCSLGYPSGFARTGSYLDWISDTTGIAIRP